MPAATRKFDQIPLQGAFLLEVFVDPLRRARLVLNGLAASIDEDTNLAKGKIYEIQFNKIIDFNIDLQRFFSAVVSHQALRESEFLRNTMERSDQISRKINHAQLKHFQIFFEDGSMEFLAEDFSCNIIWEL